MRNILVAYCLLMLFLACGCARLAQPQKHWLDFSPNGATVPEMPEEWKH